MLQDDDKTDIEDSRQGIRQHRRDEGARTRLEQADAEAMGVVIKEKSLLDVCHERLEKEKRRMKDLEANRGLVEQRIRLAEFGSPDVKPRHAQDRIREFKQELHTICNEVVHQAKVINDAHCDIMQHENRLLRAEFLVRNLAAPNVQQRLAGAGSKDAEVIAAMRVETEVQASRHLEALEHERRMLEQSKLNDVQQRIQQQIHSAAESNRTALKRIMETAHGRKLWTERIVKKEQQSQDVRLEAILQLKANTEKVAADMRSSMARSTVNQQLARGCNKAQVVENEHRRCVNKLLRGIESNKQAIAKRIVEDLEFENSAQGRSANLNCAAATKRIGRSPDNDLHQEVSTGVEPGVGSTRSTTIADESRKRNQPEHAIMGWYQSLLPKAVSRGMAGKQPHSSDASGASWLDAYIAPEANAPWEEERPDSDQEDEEQHKATATLGSTTLHELTKFEQDCLERAMRLRRERLEQGTQQVVGTRVFHCPAFVAQPAVICFKDYRLHVTHRTRVKVTNVSLTSNRFKVFDLPDDIRDLLEIRYERPGQMSPGMTCWIEITFTPRKRVDISSALKLLAETGPISVPLICTYPKVAPRITDQKLVFNGVVMGQKLTLSVKIKNDGGLATKYTIVEHTEEGEAAVSGAPDLGSSEDRGTREVTEGSGATTDEQLVTLAARKADEWLKAPQHQGDLFQYKRQGEIGPYSEVVQSFTFAPIAQGVFRRHLQVSFEGCEGGHFPLTLEGHAIEVPIYVVEPLVDMRCCMYGKLYRKDVKLKNRGKVPYSIHSSIPRILQGALEISPGTGFVQPGKDGLLLHLKFKPQCGLPQACHKYALEQQSGHWVIAVPVQVVVPDQVVPVFLTLRAEMTHGSVSLSTTRLDYGPYCFTTEAYRGTVVVKSESSLPQQVGFMDLPTVVEVHPEDGFLTLLPSEEVKLDVIFRPTAAITYDLSLQLRTTMNQTYQVRLTGQGIDPPVRLSPSAIEFASACPGDTISRSIVISNTSGVQQGFEFAVPRQAASQIKLAPAIGCLQRGQSRLITVWFCPPLDPDTIPPVEPRRAAAPHQSMATDVEAARSGPEKVEAERPEGDGSASTDELASASSKDTWCLQSRWSIPCYVQGAGHGSPSLLMLEVDTTTVCRELSIDRTSVDFGQHAVGQKKVVALRVRNHGAVEADMSIQRGVNAVGCFSVVNAIRSVGPGGTHKLLLQFAPSSQGVRTEVLLLRSETLGKELHVKLQGEGINTALSMEPASGQLDFGHVLAGRTCTRTITLTNGSPFALRYAIHTACEAADNVKHASAFQCGLVEAEIGASEKKVVEVAFSPDYAQDEPYLQTLHITVPGQANSQLVHLSGRCCRRQAFVAVVDHERATAGLLSREPPLPTPANGTSVEVPAMSALGMRTGATREIRLRFPVESPSSSTRRVQVGSAAMGPENDASAITYEIEWEDTKRTNMFTIVPDKGSVSSDGSTEVAISYKPSRPASGLSVGQWRTYRATLLLKGGYKPQLDPDVQTVVLVLEAYVYV